MFARSFGGHCWPHSASQTPHVRSTGGQTTKSQAWEHPEAATHSGPRVERMELAASTRKCKILALEICHQKIIAVLEAEGILELIDVIPSLSRGDRAGRGRSGSCGHGQRSGISNPRFRPPGHTAWPQAAASKYSVVNSWIAWEPRKPGRRVWRRVSPAGPVTEVMAPVISTKDRSSPAGCDWTVFPSFSFLNDFYFFPL